MLLCVGLFFAVSWVPSVAASEYLGDICWKFGIGPTFKLSVSYEGGDNYSLHGKGTPLLNDIESAVYGSATFKGNNILLGFTSSASDPVTNETLTVTVNGVVDSSLNGTGTAAFINFNGSTTTFNNSTGALVLVFCP